MHLEDFEQVVVRVWQEENERRQSCVPCYMGRSYYLD